MTYEFESFVIDVQKGMPARERMSFADVGWHTCWEVMEDAVERAGEKATQDTGANGGG